MIFRISAFVLAALSLLPGVNTPALAQSPAQSPSYRISGVVVDALSGQPLARAQVSITSRALPESAQGVTTGEDGRFSFENLPAGQYQLRARRKGYLDQGYKQHENFGTAVITGPDLSTDNLRFELRPMASISGQVLDELGEPVRNARVMLVRQGIRGGKRQTWRGHETITDDQGHYHFGHLASGTYFVSVIAQPWYAQHEKPRPDRDSDPNSGQTVDRDTTAENLALDVAYPVTFFSNATDIVGASPFTLLPGDAEIADITLRPVPAVHLTFRPSSAGEPEQVGVQQVTLHVADGIEEALPTATTTYGGSNVVEVFGLPPGRLTLNWTSTNGDESTTHSQTVQLAGDSEIRASDGLPSPVVIGEIQRDDAGSPPFSPGDRLFLSNLSTGRTIAAPVDRDGAFTSEGQTVVPGTYEVISYASVITGVSVNGVKFPGSTVEIGSAQEVHLTVFVSNGAGTVTGFALKNGKPADGVLVALVPQDPQNVELTRRDQSDSDGSFNLANVVPGKYTVVAIENAWDAEWSSPSFLQKYLAAGERLQVNAKAKLEIKVNVQQ